jgi:Mrp family chromosome partitioning ATPase
MSRNWDLLQKLGKDQELLNQNPLPEVIPSADAAGSFPAQSVGMSPASSGGLQQIESLVQQIFLAPTADAPHTAVFTGTETQNGSSWVCARTAEMLAARVNTPVCAVDCNLRDPGLHTQFSASNEQGLAEALLEGEAMRTYPRQLGGSNLWLVSAGTRTDAAQTFVTSDNMRQRIAELRAEFAYVLLDSAAVSLVNDAVALSSWCDGVVLVLRAQNSRREAARKAMKDFQAAKAKVLGAVLNQNW